MHPHHLEKTESNLVFKRVEKNWLKHKKTLHPLIIKAIIVIFTSVKNKG